MYHDTPFLWIPHIAKLEEWKSFLIQLTRTNELQTLYLDIIMNALGNISYIPRGLTARIAGFHPAGPGSTPGVGIKPFLSLISR